MTERDPTPGNREFSLEIETDVLVVGGGPAGCWAALNAISAGARVVLVDKGHCGSSGATASAGTQIWYVPPDPRERETAMASREAMGGYLSERRWMVPVLDKTWESVNRLAAWGYPFPSNEQGIEQRISVQGPEYMRLMGRKVKNAGVRILDHSPALELVRDDTGAIAGATGIRRQEGGNWIVRAAAVIMAAGGCAFMSKALGCDVLTGDGYLMAAEAGAELSGMEFSSAYAISPSFASITKTALYRFARFYREDGTLIEGAGSARGRSIIARTLLSEPVYARLDLAETDALKAIMRRAQPNFFIPFDRRGIDPFTERFPVTLRLDGTVRGTGGLRLTGLDCATTVPGLYAAGDNATREPICGGFTGGGSHNAAWAIATGAFAGTAAAKFALKKKPSPVLRRLGRAGYAEAARELDTNAALQAVQQAVFPLDVNYFRTEAALSREVHRLDDLWERLETSGGVSHLDLLRLREVAAMTATARWMYRAALARTETRGMHRRDDFSKQDPAQRHRLIVSGLGHIAVRPEPVEEPIFREAAE
ncbi:FAD-dependent oxidoreductase [Sinorhizobium americanum]|uniref:Succinate dehydrogenase flavoprotein subunit n=1 Tax=Sinorhizobium americanum TaxID=194963 RepID=A0A1L3LYD1_9HYPH|nr:FAD-binding protein [Sinorhizobium americanum]APG95125.1 succinate dehydrogenase flavoprotein subunit [Sinorhizobium americanum]OAP43161.1 pyridine nucleotide-disulfide oxidoreductase [Sinorhizobium americanum]